MSAILQNSRVSVLPVYFHVSQTVVQILELPLAVFRNVNDFKKQINSGVKNDTILITNLLCLIYF